MHHQCLVDQLCNVTHSFRLYLRVQNPSLIKILFHRFLFLAALYYFISMSTSAYHSSTCTFHVPDLEYLLATNNIVEVDFHVPSSRPSSSTMELLFTWLQSLKNFTPLAELKYFRSLFASVLQLTAPNTFHKRLNFKDSKFLFASDILSLQLFKRNISSSFSILNPINFNLTTTKLDFSVPDSCTSLILSSKLNLLFALSNNIKSGFVLDNSGYILNVAFYNSKIKMILLFYFRFQFLFLLVSFLFHKLYFRFFAQKKLLMILKDATVHNIEIDDFAQLFEFFRKGFNFIDPFGLQFGICLVISKFFDNYFSGITMKVLISAIQFAPFYSILSSCGFFSRKLKHVYTAFLVFIVPLLSTIYLFFPIKMNVNCGLFALLLSISLYHLLFYTFEVTRKELVDHNTVIDCSQPLLMNLFCYSCKHRYFEGSVETLSNQIELYFDWIRSCIEEVESDREL
ncbi:hypothetical protein P9112_012590 [Eukaryota sp. TZLM1-RC]